MAVIVVRRGSQVDHEDVKLLLEGVNEFLRRDEQLVQREDGAAFGGVAQFGANKGFCRVGFLLQGLVADRQTVLDLSQVRCRLVHGWFESELHESLVINRAQHMLIKVEKALYVDVRSFLIERIDKDVLVKVIT